MNVSKSFVGLGIALLASACSPAESHDAGVTSDVAVISPDAEAGPVATPDTGVVLHPGTCGRAVYNCLCNASGQAAQQMCIQGSMTCVNCIVAAQEAACPTQSAAYNACSDAAINPTDGGAGCMDQACLAAACMTQETQYNTCLRMHGTDAVYGAAVDACTGDLTMCPNQ